jgi:uncharacterized damage-inducible protein DinB
MAINRLLLGEFDHETSNTRKTLERVPADKWDWIPHAKSGTLGWLAGHVATLPQLTVSTIQLTQLEIAGADFPKVASRAELLDVFAKCSQAARDALSGVTDEQLRQTWTLTWNGKVIFTMPRYDVLRGMCFNHIVHHRAQLTMYLRALDVPVPALYGPSADEQSF